MEGVLKVAICDDELTALTAESEIIKSVLEEKGIEHDIELFETPQALIASENAYDILVLDVEMDGMDGISTAEQMNKRNENCLTFFVTNYESYLDDAFNVHAFRFWKKPIERRRLVFGIDSALDKLEKDRQFITVTKGINQIRIMLKNIICVYVVMKKVFVVTTKGEVEISDNFELISAQLTKNTDFFEPHRGYCVNFRYVKNHSKDKIYCSFGDNEYEVYLSRRKYNSFCKNFYEWVGRD